MDTDYGFIGYEAYADYREFKTYDGRQMLSWNALPDEIKEAWRMAALQITTKWEGNKEK